MDPCAITFIKNPSDLDKTLTRAQRSHAGSRRMAGSNRRDSVFRARGVNGYIYILLCKNMGPTSFLCFSMLQACGWKCYMNLTAMIQDFQERVLVWFVGMRK